ncbi:MAG: UDP-N-acetylmuramate-alanine ligase, partial [Chloroflexi bacterium]
MAPPPSKAAAAAPPPRARAAVLAGKLPQRASRRLGRGGTALPGLVAARIDGALVDRLASQLNAAILVTGTNGKTTTARMLATILESSGRVVVHNRAGSNLMRGIAAALIDAAGPSGTLPANAVGVFETDEATLPQAAAAVRPTALVIGNLSRDQLDRYGEIEAVRGQWLETIARLPATTTVVLNADDPSVSTLARAAAGPVVQFGIQDPDIAEASPAHGP